jgi:hypothetical protein
MKQRVVSAEKEAIIMGMRKAHLSDLPKEILIEIICTIGNEKDKKFLDVKYENDILKNNISRIIDTLQNDDIFIEKCFICTEYDDINRLIEYSCTNNFHANCDKFMPHGSDKCFECRIKN